MAQEHLEMYKASYCIYALCCPFNAAWDEEKKEKGRQSARVRTLHLVEASGPAAWSVAQLVRERWVPEGKENVTLKARPRGT